MYAHQGWQPVVLRTKREGNEKGEQSIREAQRLGNAIETTLRLPQNSVSVKKLDDNHEVFAHKKIPKGIADAIKNKRLELKMTQAGLAQRINEKPNVVQDVEGMKGVYDHVIINKLLRTLGLTLRSIQKPST